MDIADGHDDAEDLAEVGRKVVECATRVSRMRPIRADAIGVWHFEIDDQRFRVQVTVAPRTGEVPS